MDPETSRDYLLTEDFNDSQNDRADTDGAHMTSGKDEDESEYY